ncbi:TPA: glycosyltransferase family 4 protein [Photobacterium damselae]
MEKLFFVVNVDWYFNLHWIDRAKYLKKKGYEIHLVCKITDEKLYENIKNEGFFIHRWDVNRSGVSLFSELKSIFILYKIIKKISPSIIHAVTIKPNIYVGLINRLVKKRVIYAITGAGIVFSSKKIKFKLLKLAITRLYRLISNNNSRFIFENNQDYQLFDSLGILKNNGYVVYGAGVDLTVFHYSKPIYSNSILFAARLLREKGLNDLISAINILKERNFICQIKVAGIIDDDSNSAIPIEEIKQHEESGDIIWLGQVSDMVTVIHSCDLVCLPTTYGEGIPRILIEGASCGRAIIATNAGGCSDLIIDNVNGYLVPKNDPFALAEKIYTLISDRNKILNMGEKARFIVEEKFSTQLVCDDTYKVYESFKS